MSKMTKFSYKEYEAILKHYSPIVIDYQDVKESTSSFCLLRHDVEFSLERAVKIAKIDYDHNIKASFFVQVLNSAYNPLSCANVALLKKIESYGHNIGLHFYVSHLKEGDTEGLRNELKRQVDILQHCVTSQIDRFSYHRPPKWTLLVDVNQFTDLINVYGANFFELTDNHIPKKIKYIADSNHNWNYGHPLEIKDYKCFQLLIHPDEWSENGGSDVDNFQEIIKEARTIFIDNIASEYKTFSKIRKYL